LGRVHFQVGDERVRQGLKQQLHPVAVAADEVVLVERIPGPGPACASKTSGIRINDAITSIKIKTLK
jgi:hypothetical protein